MNNTQAPLPPNGTHKRYTVEFKMILGRMPVGIWQEHGNFPTLEKAQKERQGWIYSRLTTLLPNGQKLVIK